MEASTGISATGKGSGRDARRRRITERGSDRLALITGQIRDLPSESEPESGSNQLRGGHSYTASCPPLISQIHLPSAYQSSQPFNSSTSENIYGSLPTNNDSAHETDRQSVYGGRVGAYMRKCESSTESSRASSFDVDARGQSSQFTSIAENRNVSASDSGQHRGSGSLANKLNILQDVRSSIAATESTRALSSLAMAILVVLSYIGFPMVGSHILSGIISFRPLYLLLLTNITIVIAPLLEKLRALQRPEQQAISSSDGENGMIDQLGNALEVGLTIQSVTGALFMDCSIYSITVICFLSLIQRVGW